MSGAESKWNQRYLARDERAPAPYPWFVSRIAQLNRGSVLDLAAGDGAAALALAGQGFDVTALDIAGAGLARLQRFAEAQGLVIRTVQTDLESAAALAGLGQFDNAVITLYKPVPELWPQLVGHLHPGAKVLLSTFNLEQHQRTGFSRRFCLAPDELVAVHPQLKLISYTSTDADEQWLDHYLFERL